MIFQVLLVLGVADLHHVKIVKEPPGRAHQGGVLWVEPRVEDPHKILPRVLEVLGDPAKVGGLHGLDVKLTTPARQLVEEETSGQWPNIPRSFGLYSTTV